MKVTVYGAGYVGLVTGICLAELGNDVLIADIDATKIAQLQQGKLPIYEPGLEPMLQHNIELKRVNFTQDLTAAAQYGLYQFIAVGTPSDDTGSADLRYVLAVADTIGEHIQSHTIVINKSTVPVGTADKVAARIQAKLTARNTPVPFDVVSNPEFLKEGSAIKDFMQPDRIVLGASNPAVLMKMRELYLPLIEKPLKNEPAFITMNVHSAELTKYAANAFLATKISFINEMSQLAEKVGADIESIRLGIGSDSRIGAHFLFAGCGYGGSCFPKDIRALKKFAEQYHCDSKILDAVEEVNIKQKQILLQKVKQHFAQNLTNKTIAVWGLSFKPNTDDMREATSRVVLEGLWQEGVKVQAYDPIAMPETEKIYGKRSDLQLAPSANQALENADALVIVTEWNEFRQADLQIIKQKLQNPVIFDGRNLYDPTVLKQHGFTYYAIGRN